jgi:hypothetical protein
MGQSTLFYQCLIVAMHPGSGSLHQGPFGGYYPPEHASGLACNEQQGRIGRSPQDKNSGDDKVPQKLTKISRLALSGVAAIYSTQASANANGPEYIDRYDDAR